MEDLSSVHVGDTVTSIDEEGTEYTVIEKEKTSAGKIKAVVVEPVDGDEEERLRIPQAKWGDTWTA